MPEEFLEIIDENENVIGKAPRSEFHDPKRKEKLLHRALHVFVIDAKTGRLWVQKRGAHKDTYAGLWEVGVCGHVDPGETPEQAALREVEEEFGFKPAKVFFLGKYFAEDELQKQLNYLFWLKTVETPRKSGEASELRLVSLEELEGLVEKGETVKSVATDLKIAREKKLF